MFRFKFMSVIFACVLLTACTQKGKQQDWIRALMASCGEHTVFLNAWWSKYNDTSQPEMDPLGGYLYLYWIDEDGNACHGEPGVSGQPGPEQVLVFVEDVYNIENENGEISPNQLEKFQVIPFDLGSYTEEGLIFAQFANWFWRDREDGKIYRFTSDPIYSIPEIVSLDAEFCLVPVAPISIECARSADGMALPNPDDLFTDEPDQHPDMCKIRILPVTFSLSESERLNYCLVKLPHGLD